MIFITKRQVLTKPTAAVNVGNPLIGYENILSSGSLVADTTESGSTIENVLNDSLASLWRAADTTEQNITFTHPADMLKTNQIDYVGIARHNFGTARIGVKIQGRETSSDSFSDLTSEIMPADDSPIMFWFDTSSHHSLRVVLASGNAAAQMSVLYVGKALQLEHSLEMPGSYTPLKFGRNSDVLTGRTAANKLFIGRVSIGESYQTSANLLMTSGFFRSDFDAFLQSAIVKPFFLSMFPERYPDDVSFSWLLNDPQPVNQLEIDIDRVRIEFAGIVN